MGQINLILLGLLGALPTGPALLGVYQETIRTAKLPKRMLLAFLLGDFIYFLLAALLIQHASWLENYKMPIFLFSGLFLSYSGCRLLLKRQIENKNVGSIKRTFLSVICNPSILLFYLGVFVLISNKDQAGLLFVTTVLALIGILKYISTRSINILAYAAKINFIAGLAFCVLGLNFLFKAYFLF